MMEILVMIFSLLIISLELFFAPVLLQVSDQNATLADMINRIIHSSYKYGFILPVILLAAAGIRLAVKKLILLDQKFRHERMGNSNK